MFVIALGLRSESIGLLLLVDAARKNPLTSKAAVAEVESELKIIIIIIIIKTFILRLLQKGHRRITTVNE